MTVHSCAMLLAVMPMQSWYDIQHLCMCCSFMVMMVWEMHLRPFQLQQVLPYLHLKVSVAVHVLQHEGLSRGPEYCKTNVLHHTQIIESGQKSKVSVCGSVQKL